MTRKGPEPRCARCQRLAADMPDLDLSWAESVEDWAKDESERQRMRVEFARADGTYNSATGSFWCDRCYIVLGMPLGTAP